MNKKMYKVGRIVKLSLSRKSVPEKIVQGKTIFEMMNSNPYFLFPDPSLSDLQAVVTNLSEKAVEAEGGGKVEEAALDIAVVLYNRVVRRMGLYVQAIADGHPLNGTEIIHSAGMETRKVPQKWPVPDPVEEFSAHFTSQPDTILTKWKFSKFTVAYELYMTLTPDEPGSWIYLTSTTKRKFLVSGLESGKRYYFRLVSMGTRGRSIPSQVVNNITAF